MVVPVRDGGGWFDEQLAALAAQDYAGAWELVVADNGSVDGSPERARSWAGRIPAVRVVDAGDGTGAAHARNRGTAAARGELLAYCDADDVADPSWLSELVAAAAGASLAGGRLDDRRLNDPLVRSWRPPQQVDGDALPRPHGFLPAAASANLAVWRDVLDELGGWRAEFVGGHEDVELCWRAQLAGHQLAFAPRAVMYYRYRDRLRHAARQSFAYGYQSARLYRRYRPAGMPRSDLRVARGAWLRAAYRLPGAVARPSRRGDYVWRTAFHAGRLLGSVRFRVLFL